MTNNEFAGASLFEENHLLGERESATGQQKNRGLS